MREKPRPPRSPERARRHGPAPMEDSKEAIGPTGATGPMVPMGPDPAVVLRAMAEERSEVLPEERQKAALNDLLSAGLVEEKTPRASDGKGGYHEAFLLTSAGQRAYDLLMPHPAGCECSRCCEQ